MLYGKTLTRQYDLRGEFSPSDGSSFEIRADAAAPAEYERLTRAAWPTWPEAWDRVVELSRASLQRLPDNPFTQQQAWLCGIPEAGNGGERVQEELAAYAAGR